MSDSSDRLDVPRNRIAPHTPMVKSPTLSWLQSLKLKWRLRMARDSSDRAEAAHMLGIRGNVTAVPALVRALKDCTNVARVAAAALGEIACPAALKGLEELLDHHVPLGFRDDGVRSTAISSIEKIGDDAAVDVLIRLMKKPLLKVQAVKALRRLRNPRAAAPLAGMLGDFDQRMIYDVEYALIDIGASSVTSILPALGHRNWKVCDKACYTLEKIGAPAIEPLKKVMIQNTPIASSWAAKALLRILTKDGTLQEDIRAQCDEVIQREKRRKEAERKLMEARGLKWCHQCLSYQKTVKVSGYSDWDEAYRTYEQCAVCRSKGY